MKQALISLSFYGKALSSYTGSHLNTWDLNTGPGGAGRHGSRGYGMWWGGRGGDPDADSIQYSCPEKIKNDNLQFFLTHLNLIYHIPPSNSSSFYVQKTTHRKLSLSGTYSIYCHESQPPPLPPTNFTTISHQLYNLL